jgi:hypothetical protein
MDKQEDGTRFHAHIVCAIKDHDRDLANHPDCIKFLCSVNDNELEEIMSYNKLVSKLSLADNDDDSKVWKFCHITAHQGLLKPSDKDWNGSK